MTEFNQTYWKEMYAEDDEAIIDGLHNAKEHSRYIKGALDLAEVQVNRIGDFGFGKSILLREFVRVFKPNEVIAIDPSKEAVSNLEKQKWIKQFEHKIIHTTLEKFPQTKIKKPLDLGICNSVFQYIENNQIDLCFKKLAKFCKYVYFSVPTKTDYIYMEKELDFIDPYAKRRTKEFYWKTMAPYFTIVSHNLLESKVHTQESGFLFEFFRF